MAQPVRVCVLGGGPDAEREVSLISSKAVAEALAKDPRFRVDLRVIGRATLQEIASTPGEVIVPVLHGPWGEGGPLQELLEADGRPFVGSGAHAARLAMDKLATKLVARRLSIPTPEAAILNLADEGCPLDLPVVVKPVHEGSSVGVSICRTKDDWSRARKRIAGDLSEHPTRVHMVERAVVSSRSPAASGRELTVGVLDGRALAPIEIVPADAFYDYEAKYLSDRTVYKVNPDLPPGVARTIQAHAATLAREIGVRHLCRADFMLDDDGVAWLFEVNTMPGFTGHSLFPMAAAHDPPGLSFDRLCARLVDLALRDAAPPR